MGITASEISSLAARFGNKKVHEQTNLLAPFYAKKLRKVPKPGQTGIVNIKSGGMTSTRWMADGGTLPARASKQPVQLTYTAKALVSRGGIPRVGAAAANGVEDGVDIVMEQFDTMAADVARQRGRSYFSASLGSPSAATTANVSTTFSTVDPSGFRNGATVEVRSSGGTYIEDIEITNIAYPADLGGTCTVTFTGSGTGGACANSWGTTDVFYLKGGYDQAVTSLADVCAAASLYGQSYTSQDWSGNLFSTSGDLTVSKLRTAKATASMRSGLNPSCVVSNSVNLVRYGNAMLQGKVYFGKQGMDAGVEGTVTMDGLEWFLDENCQTTSVFLPQLEDLSVHQTIMERIERDGPAGDTKGGGNMVQWVLVAQDQLVYDAQFVLAEQLRCERRNSNSHISNVTGP